MEVDGFTYENWRLYDAIDALMAYDLGATDSGVKDEKLKQAVRDFLANLSGEDFRIAVSKYARQYMTNEMLMSGYGLEDTLSFVRWLKDELGFDL